MFYEGQLIDIRRLQGRWRCQDETEWEVIDKVCATLDKDDLHFQIEEFPQEFVLHKFWKLQKNQNKIIWMANDQSGLKMYWKRMVSN